MIDTPCPDLSGNQIQKKCENLLGRLYQGVRSLSCPFCNRLIEEEILIKGFKMKKLLRDVGYWATNGGKQEVWSASG